jgi:putative ABC transport system substrate-binding protein
MESFRQGLRQLNFIEGQNLAIELRYPQQGLQELPTLAAELVRLQVDVITAFGDYAPRVVQEATQTIPIVAMGDDLLGAGIITSLSRHGGNTTGVSILSPELRGFSNVGRREGSDRVDDVVCRSRNQG